MFGYKVFILFVFFLFVFFFCFFFFFFFFWGGGGGNLIIGLPVTKFIFDPVTGLMLM